MVYRLIARCALLLLIFAHGAQAQVILDGGPNVDDDRLYAWYNAADYIGLDGIAETPIWPNSQGEEDRSIWSAFGGADAELNLIELDSGLPAVEYIDVVSWSDEALFGTVEDGFSIFVTATVRDPSRAYFFTGNQGGGGAEVNANFDTDDVDVWSMEGEDGRLLTAEVESDLLRVHSFTFGEDGNASHHINGELVGEGEIGFGSLQGLVLGGRQNGNERATIDFAEVLIFESELAPADRILVEGYLDQKYFGGGTTLGDFDDDGELTADDIDLLSLAVRTGETDLSFDVNGDSLLSNSDRLTWINDLKNTFLGDANLDGEFNSGDLVTAFTQGQYEDEEDGNSGWVEGDWNGDGDFDSTDFVASFSEGGYEIGPRPAVAAVPEPASLVLTCIGLMTMLAIRRRR